MKMMLVVTSYKSIHIIPHNMQWTSNMELEEFMHFVFLTNILLGKTTTAFSYLKNFLWTEIYVLKISFP